MTLRPPVFSAPARSAAAAVLCMFPSAAGLAQTGGRSEVSLGTCVSLWTQATNGVDGPISLQVAEAYAVNVGAIDLDGDDFIYRDEFVAGCIRGLIQPVPGGIESAAETGE